MNILGSTDVYEQVQKQDLCVDCGACVGLCPYFVSYKGKVARLFPCIASQGRCHAYCPKTEIDVNALSQAILGKPYDGSALGHVQAIWKTRRGKALNTTAGFQNGGTTSALVLAAMDAGLIDAAALTSRKGLCPEPVLARSHQEVLACTGSKYMASPTLASVNAYTRTRGRTLAVVGTPCQMTALARMRMNPLSCDDFHDPVALSIGLFCTWALDTRRLMTLLADRLNPEELVSMDVPPPPAECMLFQTKEDVLRIPLEDIRTAIPAGCRICPDMTAEFSDLSVGALEGESGWNTLIVRTQNGEALVERAVEKGYLERKDMPADQLQQLSSGALCKKKRALSTARDKQLLNTAPGQGHSALIVDPDLVDALLGKEDL